ncbi:MAG: uracil-DNA glycosylase [Desulfoarculaceae bacterium]|nr:uracil-DNA glycosylase [Desulfoarculaceae bacterium]
MDSQRFEIIRDVQAVLAYHHCLGIEAYPQEAGIVHLLERKIDSPARIEKVTQQLQMTTVAETLEDLGAEIHGCRNCELHAIRVVPVAGRGGSRARLLIVGGWLTAPEPPESNREMVFGLEEDRMVSRMLEAIHLDPGDVFVTNILKCGLPGSCQPVAANIQSCHAYLRRQIAVLAPELICAMGTIATRTLLELPQSLSQLRGHFHTYTALDGREIPLMATYHPSYLLQAEEMKKETWKDLQLIAKRLAG